MRFFSDTQRHFKSRGFRFYGFGLNFTIRAIWAIVSPIVEKKIKNKIKITNNNTHEDLWNWVHPSQVEQRYGGDAPDLTEYWPPRKIPGEIGYDPQLISDEPEVEEHKSQSGNVKRNQEFPKNIDTPAIASLEEIHIEQINNEEVSQTKTKKQTADQVQKTKSTRN